MVPETDGERCLRLGMMDRHGGDSERERQWAHCVAAVWCDGTDVNPTSVSVAVDRSHRWVVGSR